jgi:hypothetical protein
LRISQFLLFFAIKMQNTQNVVTIYKAPIYVVLVKAEKAYQGQTTQAIMQEFLSKMRKKAL